MPQLLPFYFVNQISFLFFGLATLTYFFSKYFLPSQLQLSLARAYLTSI